MNLKPSQRLSFSSSASVNDKGHRKQAPSTRYDNAEEIDVSEVSAEDDFEAEKDILFCHMKTLEKYEGILKQKTFNQDNNRTHKSFMNGLADTDFAKEANKTTVEKESGVKARGLSQNRLDNVWKRKQPETSRSLGRNTSKKPLKRENSHLNTLPKDSLKENPSTKTITKRVGGGYSSVTRAAASNLKNKRRS